MLRVTTLVKYSDSVAGFALLISSFWLLFRLLNLCSNGLDFTDEGYYLNWISDPTPFKISATQFGFLIHPFFRILGYDVALLRQINLAVTFLLALTVFWNCLNLFGIPSAGPSGQQRIPLLSRLGICAAFSSAALLLFSRWLPTPNYNTLSLQSLLIVAIGLIRSAGHPTSSGNSRQTLERGLTLGLGAWLGAMAKPTLGIAIAVLISAHLLAWRPQRVALLFVSLSISAALTILSALVIDGSLPGFIHRLLLAAKSGAIMNPRYGLSSVFRLDSISFSNSAIRFTLVSFLLLLLGIRTVVSRRPYTLKRLTPLFIAGVALISLFLPPEFWSYFIPNFKGQSLLVLPMPLALLSVALVREKIGLRLPRAVRYREGWLAVSFAAFPYCFAFGTGNNYLQQQGLASVFWVLSGVSLYLVASRTKSAWLALFPAAAFVQAMAVALMSIAVLAPYRQPEALSSQHDRILINNRGAELNLTESSADYIRKLRDIATSHGFSPATPLIDLTGLYPGAQYVLGARPVGFAWLLGGYRGSEPRATMGLDLEPCEILMSSWVLLEPAGPKKLPTSLLSPYGLDIDQDFEIAGRLTAPRNNKRQSDQEHILLRPSPKRTPGKIDICRARNRA